MSSFATFLGQAGVSGLRLVTVGWRGNILGDDSHDWYKKVRATEQGVYLLTSQPIPVQRGGSQGPQGGLLPTLEPDQALTEELV